MTLDIRFIVLEWHTGIKIKGPSDGDFFRTNTSANISTNNNFRKKNLLLHFNKISCKIYICNISLI